MPKNPYNGPMSDKHDDYDIPSIVPERDELVSHRSRKRGNSLPGKEDKVVYSSGGGTSGPVRFLLSVLFLAMLGTGATGYIFYIKGQEALGQLQNAQNRIADLENRLSAVGNNAEETTLNLVERLDFNFSEIDKLWAARNANVSSINELEETTESQAEVLSSLESAVSNQAGRINNSVSQLETLQTRIENITENFSGLANLNQELTRINQEMEQVRASLTMLQQDLAPRLAVTEEDIESINVFRLQVNQTLSAMQQSINQLQDRVGRGPIGNP